MAKINNDFIDIDYIKNELKEVYSTNEVKTNKIWLGKPIYTKTFQYTVLPANENLSQYVNIAHNISNVDNIFVDYSHSYVVWKNEIKLCEWVRDKYYNIGFKANRTNLIYFIGGYHVNNSAYMYITITVEYTKTTD